MPAVSPHLLLAAKAEQAGPPTADSASMAAWNIKMQYDHQTALANMDVLQELAGDTGGAFFHDNNDFVAGLKLLASQPEYIYVLGFAPRISSSMAVITS